MKNRNICGVTISEHKSRLLDWPECGWMDGDAMRLLLLCEAGNANRKPVDGERDSENPADGEEDLLGPYRTMAAKRLMMEQMRQEGQRLQMVKEVRLRRRERELERLCAALRRYRIVCSALGGTIGLLCGLLGGVMLGKFYL